MLVCKIKKKLKGFTLDVNITADRGVTALMGASGSGKSMTLRCIAGITKPDEGYIELDGKVLFDSEKKINIPPQNRNTGFLFQDYALFPNKTVRQNIMTGVKDKNKDIKIKRAEELAHTYHIPSHLDKYPHQLSGGEKQRCALARIFAGSPDILMLDEPFTAMDSHLRWELEAELAAVFKNFNKPVLYISHNRDEAFRLSGQIAIISAGKNEEAKEKHALFKNPQTLQAARLTGCKNIAKARLNGNTVTVPDWGLEFDLPHGAACDLQYIGIRANQIIPASAVKEGEAAVVMPFEIVDEIEDTFKIILMARKKNTNLSAIRWEMPKKDRNALLGGPQELAFLHENILLLK
jgi:molybdate transport system ATP-binding protein